MPTLELHTDRLSLRPLQAQDLPVFAAYRALPQVARYQGWEPSFSFQDAVELLARQDAQRPFAARTGTQIALVRRSDDQMVGDCYVGIQPDPRIAEIGFTLAPQHQGQGYATEAVRALLAWLFEARKVHRVQAVTDLRNTASMRVLERVGLRREAVHVDAVWFKGDWSSEAVYALLRREWR